MSTHEYYDKYGIENFEIEIIKEYNVYDEKQLHSYEQLWINKNKNKCVNKKNFFEDLIKSNKYIKEFSEGKITCECGTVVKQKNYIQHTGSNKHKKFIKNIIHKNYFIKI